jgi:hypothetical protein
MRTCLSSYSRQPTSVMPIKVAETKASICLRKSWRSSWRREGLMTRVRELKAELERFEERRREQREKHYAVEIRTVSLLRSINQEVCSGSSVVPPHNETHCSL